MCGAQVLGKWEELTSNYDGDGGREDSRSRTSDAESLEPGNAEHSTGHWCNRRPDDFLMSTPEKMSDT